MRVVWTMVCAAASLAMAQPVVTFRGTTTLPASTTDQNGVMFTITGVSGVAYAGAAGDQHLFLAVMDNSNKVLRIQARFNADGSLAASQVIGGVSLAETRDFEGIVALTSTRVLLSEEGTPGVHEYDLTTGQRLASFAIPSVYSNRRANFGFESLAAGPRNELTGMPTSVWTCNEEALTVDGPLSTSTTGSVVRVMEFTGVVSPATRWQKAYVTAPVHATMISQSRSGVSELAWAPGRCGGVLLSLERSLAFDIFSPYQSRMYALDASGAADVSSSPGLAGQSLTPIQKRLVWTGSVGNLEGLCVGPALDSTRYAMVGVVDNGDGFSQNVLAAFELGGIAPSSTCDVDLNADGSVDFNDYLEFLNLYNASNARVDFNCDGAVDFNDYLEFLNLYNTSC